MNTQNRISPSRNLEVVLFKIQKTNQIVLLSYLLDPLVLDYQSKRFWELWKK